MTSRRLPALVLLLALVAGGFGLPIADALIYHSTPVREDHSRSATGSSLAESGLQDRTVDAPTSSMHLQGCVLWLSGVTGSGVVPNSPTLALGEAAPVEASFTAPQFVVTQTDIALGQSRAPPIA